ncbi:MAG: protein kinase, partial [Deltaproteobacteria bacterium]|nr:protein kinase [Deltaproteobacteria bacterium]
SPRRGIEHRDFKPENVLVSDRRQWFVVRVGDFGIARLLDRAPPDELRFRGTWPYMPPERVIVEEGKPADDARSDARSDLYSFCVTLWEALYGCRPYKGTSPQELAASWSTGHLRVENPRPGVPQEIMKILRVGLAVEPAERYASMDVLLARLAEVPELAMREREGWAVRGLIVLATALLTSTVMLAATLVTHEGEDSGIVDESVGPVADASTDDTNNGVESDPPSLDEAIELAKDGDYMECWAEVRRTDERGGLEIGQLLALAEILYEDASNTSDADARTLAINAGLRVSRRARKFADTFGLTTEYAAANDLYEDFLSLKRGNPRSRPRWSLPSYKQ